MTEEEYQAAYNEGVLAGAQEERLKIVRALISNPSLVAECCHINDINNTVFIPGRFIAALDGTPDPTLRDDSSI
jgi:hypothetical protein